jgi:hypothetical protein
MSENEGNECQSQVEWWPDDREGLEVCKETMMSSAGEMSHGSSWRHQRVVSWTVGSMAYRLVSPRWG